MITAIKGTTPTFIFETDAAINLTEANEVWVTFSKYTEEEIFTKTGADLEVTAQSVSVFLSQEETLSLPLGKIKAQINWIFEEDGTEKRAASNMMTISTSSNLIDEELH